MRKFDELHCAVGVVAAGVADVDSEKVRSSRIIRHRCSSVSRFLKDGIGLRPSVSL
jgi:hypothetical protein